MSEVPISAEGAPPYLTETVASSSKTIQTAVAGNFANSHPGHDDPYPTTEGPISS